MRVAVAGRDVARTELLHEGQDEAAEGGAGDVAQSAEDDDGEGFQRGQIAHRRVDEEHGAEQRAGRGGEPRAQREGRGVDAVDVHAHQRRGLAVLEGRAHGLAELGAVDEGVGGRRSAPARRQTRTGECHDTEPDQHQRRSRERRVDRLGHARPSEQLGVLQRDPGADHHQHGGVDAAPRSGRSSTNSMAAPSARRATMASDEGQEEVHARASITDMYIM